MNRHDAPYPYGTDHAGLTQAEEEYVRDHVRHVAERRAEPELAEAPKPTPTGISAQGRWEARMAATCAENRERMADDRRFASRLLAGLLLGLAGILGAVAWSVL